MTWPWLVALVLVLVAAALGACLLVLVWPCRAGERDLLQCGREDE